MDSPLRAELNGISLNTLSRSNRISVLAPMGYNRFEEKWHQLIRFDKTNRCMCKLFGTTILDYGKIAKNRFWQGKNEDFRRFLQAVLIRRATAQEIGLQSGFQRDAELVPIFKFSLNILKVCIMLPAHYRNSNAFLVTTVRITVMSGYVISDSAPSPVFEFLILGDRKKTNLHGGTPSLSTKSERGTVSAVTFHSGQGVEW